MKSLFQFLKIAGAYLLLTYGALADDLQTMAQAVSASICDFHIHPGSKGQPIFIFEESHDSVVTNLLEAVGLVRLHNRYNVHAVGLEGFIKPGTFSRVQPVDRERALASIGAGDISSAEFLYLAYADVAVYAVENAGEWLTQPPSVDTAVAKILNAIALKSFTDKLASGGISADDKAEFNRLVTTKDASGLRKFLFSKDSFVASDVKQLSSSTPMSNDDEIKFFQELSNQARVAGADVASSSATLNAYISFLQKRRQASDTMSGTVVPIADKSPIAMVIGSAHTSDVLRTFDAQKRPAVVFTCTASFAGIAEKNYTQSQMDRKYARQLPGDGFIDSSLREVFGGNVKPQPVVNTPSYEAKSELYAKVDDLVRILFRKPPSNSPATAPGSNGNGLPPPTDWSPMLTDSPEFRRLLLALPDDRYSGKYVVIDKSNIEIVHEAAGDSLLMSVLVHNEDKTKQKRIWVRAGLSAGFAILETPDQTEQQLLDIVHKQQPAPRDDQPVDISAMTAMLSTGDKDTALHEKFYTENK
jgi:hypothetical protein